MGQRARTLTQIFGFDGFRVNAHFETELGVRVTPDASPALLRGMTLVLEVSRRWLARCGGCGSACRRVHERLRARRWLDMPWAEHPVVIEYAPVRVKCRNYHANPTELIAWAEPHQRQTRRLRQHLAVARAARVRAERVKSGRSCYADQPHGAPRRCSCAVRFFGSARAL
jgi:hypothetical protein